MMGYKARFFAGEFPESGAIFMCNKRTKEECLEGKLFGLPSNMTDLVLNVRKGMTLFLFEYENRLLHGVFRATSDGGINIDREAFRSSGKSFPAQIRISTVMHCIPLEEYEFKYIIIDNYFSANKFRFGLNEKQVNKLLNLFRSKKRCEKRLERGGDARSRYRKNMFQNRLSFDYEGEDVKNIDDRYRLTSTNTYENHYRENRESEVSRSQSSYHLGSPCDRSWSVTDKYSFGLETVDSERKTSTNTYENHYCENSASEVSRSQSSYHLGSPCDRSRTITDKYSFGLETVDRERKPLKEYSLGKSSYDGSCTLRPISLSEHTFLKQRETSFGPRPDDDGSFRFRSVVPTAYSSIREPILTRDNSSFIPLEGPDMYFDDLDYALLDKRHHIVEENQEEREFKTVSQEGSYNPLFPDFISKRLPSSDSGICLREEESVGNDKRFHQQAERKHLFGTDRRVSVFARLNSTLKHGEQESETDEKHKLDASVNKVMRMLEKVVSSPIRRKGKSKSTFKNDDDENNSRDFEIVDYETPDVQMEPDADLADDVVEGGSVLPETRLLDYNRRKKAVKSIDSSQMPTKRRKIVRPAFDEKKVTAADEKSFIDDSISAKVILDNPEKVDAAIESVDINMLSSNDDEKSSVAKYDKYSTKKVDAFVTLSNAHENSPDDSISAKVILDNPEKVDASIESVDINMLSSNDDEKSSVAKYDKYSTKRVDAFVTLSNAQENSPDDCNSTKALLESSKTVDIVMQPTCKPSKDVSSSIEAVIESSEKVEAVEVCSKVEKDEKSKNCAVLDVFAKVNPVASVKN